MKKILGKVLVFTLAVMLLLPSSAIVQASQDILIFIDQQSIQLENTFIKDGRTYAPVRAFSTLLGAEVLWDGKQRKVTLLKDHNKLEFVIGEKVVYYNGKKLFMDTPSIIENDWSYLPLRFTAEALYHDVNWDGVNQTIYLKEKPTYIAQDGDTLTKISEEFGINIDDLKEWNQLVEEELQAKQKIYLEPVHFTSVAELSTQAVVAYQEEEIDWLAKIIYAEAQDEPYEGLVAVGAVVINRVQSPWYPNTIYDVIFQPYQFTPATTGKIYKVVPDELSYQAAYEALMGSDPVDGALYFYNPKIAKSTFFQKRGFVRQIGNHRFVK